MNAALRKALRNYSRTLADTTQRAGGSNAVSYRWQYGTVTAVDAGTSVTVTVDGNELVAPYHASYSNPAIGHVVRVDFRGNSPIVVDRVIGVTAS